MALLTDGTVWGWGDNSKGQIGDGSITFHYAPARAGSLTGVTTIAAGAQHSLAVAGTNNSVWVWGANDQYQLGDATPTQHNSPEHLALAGVTAIAGGELGSAAILSNGTLWTWGSNVHGVLGMGSIDYNARVPTQVRNVTGVADVSMGAYSTLAVATTFDPSTVVPQMFMLTQVDALRDISAAGLVVGAIIGTVSPYCGGIGLVASSYPMAGTVEAPGTAVNIDVYTTMFCF